MLALFLGRSLVAIYPLDAQREGACACLLSRQGSFSSAQIIVSIINDWEYSPLLVRIWRLRLLLEYTLYALPHSSPHVQKLIDSRGFDTNILL